MAAARVAFTQPGHPSRGGTLRLVSGSKVCSPATSGIVCVQGFSLFSGTVNYKLELLDSHGGVTFTRSGSTPTSPGSLTFVLANRYTNATVTFADPVMGAPSRVNLSVTPFLQDTAYAGIPISVIPFTKPIRLIDDDKTGATALSTALVYSSGQSVTLAYDGESLVNPRIEAQPSSGSVQRLVPILRSTEWALPGKRESSTGAGFGRMYVNNAGSITFLAHDAIDTVSPTGQIVEQLLPGYEFDIARGADGLPWTVLRNATASAYDLVRVNAGGALTLFALREYSDATFVLGPDKQFWMPVVSQDQSYVVRRITEKGKITDFKAPADTQGLDGVSPGPAHSVWFAAFGSDSGSILQVSPVGKMTAYALPKTSRCCAYGSVTNLAWNGGRALYAVAARQYLLRFSPGEKTQIFPAMMNMEDSAASPPIDPPLAFGPDGAMWYVAQSLDAGLGCNIEIGRVTTEGKVANAQLASACPKTFPATPTAFVAGPGNTLWYTRGSLVGKVIL
jgi:hypothetical protein